SFAFAVGRIAKTAGLRIDTPFASIWPRGKGSGVGLLSLAALTFSTIGESQAAGSDVGFLDDGKITYKDLEHGTFELQTKGANPRTIIVDDPGETIVLSPKGSSVSVDSVTNSSADMGQLQAAQRDALANYVRGLSYGPTDGSSHGSSSQPIEDPAS